MLVWWRASSIKGWSPAAAGAWEDHTILGWWRAWQEHQSRSMRGTGDRKQIHCLQSRDGGGRLMLADQLHIVSECKVQSTSTFTSTYNNSMLIISTSTSTYNHPMLSTCTSIYLIFDIQCSEQAYKHHVHIIISIQCCNIISDVTWPST